VCTVRDTEFRAQFFCYFKKLRCKSLFIINVTFKSQILKFISIHVNRMSIKLGKIEVNNVKPILHFLTLHNYIDSDARNSVSRTVQPATLY
jgi:hypothetical protein